MKKRASQFDIAQASGVSQSAVSAVFNPTPSISVSAKTRQRVLDAAERLGYRPRFVPSNGWGGARTRLVVLLASRMATGDAHLPAVGAAKADHERDLLDSILVHLEERGYSLIVKHLSDEKSLRGWLQEKPVEGVIWRGARQGTAFFSWLAKKYPLVVVNRFLAPAADRVLTNQEENITIPAEHLRSLGHRRIAYFGHVPGGELTDLRARVYRAWAAGRGLRIYEEFFAISDAPEIPGAAKAKRILDIWARFPSRERPTALILSDGHAFHLLHEARERGVRIPSELSVVGIDNLSYGAASHPPLTSVHQPYDEIGRAAVELLLSRVDEPDRMSRMVLVSPRLVERGSVRAVRVTASA